MGVLREDLHEPERDGLSLAPDSIQALNPFFIVAFIGGALGGATLWPSDPNAPPKKDMPPTQKMLIGFLLTAGCMGIMSFAGYQTGEPETATLVKCKEVEVLLPLGTVETNTAKLDFNPKDKKDAFVNTGGKAKFPEGSAKELTFTKYGSVSGDKVSFKDGELVLADGKKLVFKGGQLDFEKSREHLQGRAVGTARGH